ncbi:MAG: hypothetical protein U0R52_10395 [Solirubrobacterales bacterium]
MEGPAAVTLRRPVPVGRQLALERAGEGARVTDGDDLVAEVRPSALALDVPAPVSPEEAELASSRFTEADEVFAHCFVCGTRREDSQRVFAGPLDVPGSVASPWTPGDRWLAPDGGRVLDEFVWAVLDCPTAYALWALRPGRLAMLGRMSAEVTEPVGLGEPCVVMAWTIESEGRKHRTGAALFGPGGRRKAVAEVLMIEVGAIPLDAAGRGGPAP